jgi:glycosyltransferase involved in cell wall biosynthesis
MPKRTNKIKVFVFGIRGFPLIGGGAERHSEELYPRMIQDFDITVLARTAYFEHWRGVKFVTIPYIKWLNLETMSHSIMCTFYCLKHKPDIVHIHNMGACLLVPLLMWRNIRVIFTIHSLNYLHKKWGFIAKAVLNLCELIGLNFSDRITTVSTSIKDYLRKKYQRAMPMDYIPNAVNPPKFMYSGIYLKKHGLKPRGYALAVGRLVPEKGFDKLIEAYKIAKVPFKLVIAGDGETQYAKDLRKLQSDDIIFTGYINGDELAEMYTNTGLMILSSFNEGFPLVMLEALSFNIPIIASNIDAHKHIRLASHRYYIPDDTHELAKKMQIFFNAEFTPEEKITYKHLLENEYDWDMVPYKIKRIYEYTLGIRSNTGVQ